MSSITATARTARTGRLAAIAGVALVLTAVVVTLILTKTGPGHELHQVIGSFHHLSHPLRALLGAAPFGSGN
jgi:hypothetical protein